MGCQANWPANERSHTVVDGYPHERVRCTADRYEDLTAERDHLRAEVERLRPVIDAATKWAETDWCTCHQPHCDECELRRAVGRTKGTL